MSQRPLPPRLIIILVLLLLPCSASPLTELLGALDAHPLRIDAALRVCEGGGLPVGAASTLRLVGSAADGVNLTLDAVLLRALPTAPAAVSLLACLVERDVIIVPELPDGGAALLHAAVTRKHLRLLALALKRGALTSHISTDSGFALLHECLSNRILVLDVTSRLLYLGDGGGASGGTFGGSSLSFIHSTGALFCGQVAAWEKKRAAAPPINTRLPPADVVEAQLVCAAVAKLSVYPALRKVGEPPAAAARTSVSAAAVQTVANALSLLMLRIILEGGPSATTDAVRRTRVLLLATDVLGRTPLHVAAAAGNAGAVNVLLRAVYLDAAPGSVAAEDLATLPEPIASRAHAATVVYVDQVDALGLNAAALACDASHWRVVSLLMKALASPPPCPRVGDTLVAGELCVASHAVATDNEAAVWCESQCPSVTYTATTEAVAATPAVAAAAMTFTVRPTSHAWPSPRLPPPPLAVAAIEIASARAVRLAAAEAEAFAGRDSATPPRPTTSATAAASDARSVVALQCEVDVVDAREWVGAMDSTTPLPSSAAASFAHMFTRRFAARRRPVLLRGAAAGWAALQHAWSAASLMCNHSDNSSSGNSGSSSDSAAHPNHPPPCAGDVLFRASQIPYEKAFRRDARVLSVTLREHAYAVLMCDWEAGGGGGDDGDHRHSGAGDNEENSRGAAPQPLLPAFRPDHAAVCGAYAAAYGAPTGPTRHLPFYIFDAPPTSPPSLSSVRVNAAGGDDAPHVTVDEQVAIAATAARTALLVHVPLVPYFLDAGVPVMKKTRLTSRVNGGDTHPDSSAAAEDAGQSLPFVTTLPTPPKPQFYLGGPGSGAPLHYHKDAVNIAVSGLKRWYVLPPACAAYSTAPVAMWVAGGAVATSTYSGTAFGSGNSSSSDGGGSGGGRSDSMPLHINDVLPPLVDASGAIVTPGCGGVGGPSSDSTSDTAPHRGGGSSRGRPLECSQDAGDVMFIPSGWGHAVLNLEVSVGVALEFASPLGRY